MMWAQVNSNASTATPPASGTTSATTCSGPGGNAVTKPAPDADLDQYSYGWWPVSTKEGMQRKHTWRPDAVIRWRTAQEIQSLIRWARVLRRR
jgi:hypothetical protein